jgi:hypothetical protein
MIFQLPDRPIFVCRSIGVTFLEVLCFWFDSKFHETLLFTLPRDRRQSDLARFRHRCFLQRRFPRRRLLLFRPVDRRRGLFHEIAALIEVHTASSRDVSLGLLSTPSTRRLSSPVFLASFARGRIPSRTFESYFLFNIPWPVYHRIDFRRNARDFSSFFLMYFAA